MKGENTNYYNEYFAKYYDLFTKHGYYDYEKEVNMLTKLIRKNQSILEIGIGTGNIAIELKKKGYNIEGIEPSKYMIKELKKKLLKEKINIPVFCIDAAKMNLHKKYDVIISFGALPVPVIRNKKLVFEFMIAESKIPLVMKKIREYLKNNGRLILRIQSDKQENIEINLGEVKYKNEIRIKGKKGEKTHYFIEKGKEHSQTIKFIILPDNEFKELLKKNNMQIKEINEKEGYIIIENAEKPR